MTNPITVKKRPNRIYALLNRKHRDKISAPGLQWIRREIGWSLERAKAPAVIKEFVFVDLHTNEMVYLSTGNTYSIFSVGNRQFYFNRLTGALDGTSLTVPDGISDRAELAD